MRLNNSDRVSASSGRSGSLWATNVTSSEFNICRREQAAHHSAFRERVTTINRSISTVISVRVFMTFPFGNEVQLHTKPVFVDRKSTRLNSSHGYISYAVFCLKKKVKSAVRLLLRR